MNKVYAVADLHGQYNLWRQVIDYLDDTDTLYILGDCGDRDIDGWKIIKEALVDPRVKYIRGNHDQMLLDAWYDNWDDKFLWLYNGGYDTFNSIIADDKANIYLNGLSKTGIYCLYNNTQGQKIHLSHAGFTPSKYANKFPDNEDLIWDRTHFRDRWPKDKDNEYIIHGHTWCGSKYFLGIDKEINDTITVSRYADGHKICIDGRSFLYGRVALLDLDTLEEIVFTESE